VAEVGFEDELKFRVVCGVEYLVEGVRVRLGYPSPSIQPPYSITSPSYHHTHPITLIPFLSV
jgi:hypothetical protein